MDNANSRVTLQLKTSKKLAREWWETRERYGAI